MKISKKDFNQLVITVGDFPEIYSDVTVTDTSISYFDNQLQKRCSYEIA